jgi:hypothetical protein
LGLNGKAVASIRAARKLESKFPYWSATPANEQLFDRKSNEAYLSAAPGSGYALYMPAGGEVQLENHSPGQDMAVYWIDVESGEWGPQGRLAGDRPTLAAPDGKNWAAAIVSAALDGLKSRTPAAVE